MKTFSRFGGLYLQLLVCGIILIFSTLNNTTYAQENTTETTEVLPKPDSTEPKALPEKLSHQERRRQRFGPDHTPVKAVLFGIIPGGGQIYNQRWWKLPIVYAGLGGLGYWAYYNNDLFRKYRQAYKAEVDEDSTTFNTFQPSYSAAQLKLERDRYLQSFEYAMVGFFGFYLLSITEAFVDAHLMQFDVSDDLSLKIKPNLDFNAFSTDPLRNGWSGGVKLQFQFKTGKKMLNPLY